MRDQALLGRQFSAKSLILTAAMALVIGGLFVSSVSYGGGFSPLKDVAVPVYPQGTHSLVTQLNDQQIADLFMEISQLPLPYAATGDCCQDRALYIANWAETHKGIHVVKVFVTGDFQPPNNVLNQEVRWQFHVAVAVQDTHGNYMILDPSVANQALSIQDWLKRFSKKNPTIAIEIFIKERFTYIPAQLDFTRTSWDDKEIEMSSDSLLGCQAVQDHYGVVLNRTPVNVSPALQKKLGDLNPLWAQQMVGADLARQYLKTQKTQAVPTLIWDYGFSLSKYKMFLEHPFINQAITPGEHGTKVLSLLTSSGPQAITDMATIEQLADVGYAESAYPEAAAKLSPSSRVRPLNLSMGWDELFDYVKNSMQQAEKMNALIVNADGNQFPDDFSDMEEFSLPPSLIGVGSLTPDGYISLFSKFRRNTFIFTPSDLTQVSKDSKMNYVSFGFTSGAAPMVTGTLVNVLSLLPDLTMDQLKLILKKSSIAMVSAKVSKTWLSEGAAMLNTYKAVRVAGRVQQMLKSGTDIQHALADDRTYDFSYEAFMTWNNIKNDMAQDFPLCVAGPRSSSPRSNDSMKQESDLASMRTLFLLDSNSGFYANVMACLLNSIGRKTEALFYSHRGASAAVVSRDLLRQIEKDRFQNNLAIRNVNFLTDSDFKQLVGSKYNLLDEDRMVAYALRENVDLKAAESFYQSLDKQNKIEFLARSAPNKRLAFRLHALAYQSKDDDLNMEALELLRYFPQSEAADLFIGDFLSKPDPMLPRKMIGYLDQVTAAQKARVVQLVKAFKNTELIGLLN